PPFSFFSFHFSFFSPPPPPPRNLAKFPVLLLLFLMLCTALPAEELPEGPALFAGDKRFWSVGALLGTSFTAPWVIGTIQGTASFLPYTILELGIDVGAVHGERGQAKTGYDISLYPFIHINGYLPRKVRDRRLGWYAGMGGGLMAAFHTDGGKNRTYLVPAMDATTGLHIGRDWLYVTIAYTLRTDFDQVNHKVSLGYSHRIETKLKDAEEKGVLP
ncbi:hypothetical protein LQZ21_08710, partial [Treponema sp. TIM-1]|uniref:hypothetical protein n=1 Tax=Treponema sp. TIM-1 TaxID=2898417 RepID=UPI00397F150B